MKTIEGRFLSHADACCAAVSTGAHQTRRTRFNRLHRVRAAGVLFPRSNLSAQAAVAPVVVSGMASKALLAHESESEAQQDGFLSRLSVRHSVPRTFSLLLYSRVVGISSWLVSQICRTGRDRSQSFCDF